MRKGKLHIGTSGWHYKHWVGAYYPAATKDSEMLALYQQQFSTVELNNSFYNLPLASTFKHWKEASPGGFVFAAKGSRYISHMKKLHVDKTTISKFINRLKKLGDKLGPILFQLPPGWHINTERLADFLGKLPGDYRYTFEFRNESWYTDEVYQLLAAHNCAFCMYELAGHRSPEEVTADFLYIRLHGPGDKYQGSYDKKTLGQWAKKMKQWQKAGMDVYIYFDNDQAGYAAFNAAQLVQLCK